MTRRTRGEGTIYTYRSGYAAQLWVTTPHGGKERKTIYGKSQDEVRDKLLQLRQTASRGPVATRVPKLGEYLTYWIQEVVEPHTAPATSANYELFVRLYIAPSPLARKRLDRLKVRDVQTWINALVKECQCCAQGKDAARRPAEQRCCAVDKCCERSISERSAKDAWATLRNALNSAIREELIFRNVAELVKVPKPRRKKEKPWSVEEARQFLESARRDRDRLYPAYVQVLVLGFRRGEALGTTDDAIKWDGWDGQCATHDVRFCSGCFADHDVELLVAEQVQRINGRLLRREVKTESSEAPIPLPAIAATALALAIGDRDQRRRDADAWEDSNLLLTTTNGRPIEPRNFNRSFEARCRKAGVRRIKLHTTRKTCASLLVALDVHPRVAMQVLRHSQISVTMNIYTEVSSKESREALKRLGDSLTGPNETP